MNKTKHIQVLVVEDHIVVREGLCALINAQPDMAVVGQADNGIEAALQASALQPDVILMDLWMPRKGGIEAIGEIKAENPAARILVLTSFAEDQKVFQAIAAGALGYLVKDSSSQDLVHAIRQVHQGDLTLNHTMALKVARELSRVPSDTPSLTERELEVLKLVAQGRPNPEIAIQLGIGERTVTTHVSNILGKLELKNRTQAALYAVREGLIELK